ncbi:hypothetical protein FisN_18Hh006 [Fistulifera solaris]|uniref:Uncharacterized protein n=1 Tax=Fistulifera solaris TaxID=1519565 RepID=A0A1Z5JVC0_FISSO|nr:hypothetical protein FisN_18Hh006 [Fistulifera solaris]|eukprot:GAX17806.1 hypothetical protein FisN_18Hh006 [Fistulifera solaris]
MLFSSIVAFLFFATSTVAQPPCTDKGKGVIDDCCTEDLPICVHWNGAAAHGVTGHHCALCINSQFPLSTRQTAPDEGCDEEFRVCVGDRPLAASVEGKDCAVCVNSLQSFSDPNDMDDGCPPQAPVCVNDSGADPPIRTRGTQCVAKCVDTSLTGSDQGCSRKYPICVLADGSDPCIGVPGVKCAKCSPASCNDGDPCTDDFCDPDTGCYHVPIPPTRHLRAPEARPDQETEE